MFSRDGLNTIRALGPRFTLGVPRFLKIAYLLLHQIELVFELLYVVDGVAHVCILQF